MSFGIEKCRIASLHRGWLVQSDNVILPPGDSICSLGAEESYQYLGILESGSMHHQSMKQHLIREYRHRVRKILSTQLCGNYTVQAINSFAIPLLRYSVGLIDWTKKELYQADVETRKLMCLHHVFSMNSDIDRLYVPRSQGGRGLCSVADAIEGECRSLGLYVEKSSQPLLKAVHAKKWFSSESTSEFKARVISLHYDNWLQKALHGQFYRETSTHVDNKWQRVQLKSSGLSPEVEGYIFAAQEQAITMNVMNNKIFKLQCRLSLDCAVQLLKQLLVAVPTLLSLSTRRDMT